MKKGKLVAEDIVKFLTRWSGIGRALTEDEKHQAYLEINGIMAKHGLREQTPENDRCYEALEKACDLVLEW